MNRDEHKLRDAFQRNLDDLRPSTPIESIRRGARRGRIVTALATALFVAVAGIGGYALTRTSREQQDRVAGPGPESNDGLIAFVTQGPRDPSPWVAVVPAEGSGGTRLHEGRDPSWSPDGSRLAFGCDRGICTMNADGSDVRHLTDPEAPAFDETPDWGANGWIAFTRNYMDNPRLLSARARDIVLVPEEGGELVTITTHDTDDLEPSWSPDGRSLVFIRAEGGLSEAPPGGWHLWTMDADGGGAEMLTDIDGPGHPDWSPDGATILFDRNSALWTIPAEGGTVEKLAMVSGNAMDVGAFPSWAPDSRHIVYTCSVSGFDSNDLCTTDSTSDGWTPLIATDEDEVSSAWQPTPVSAPECPEIGEGGYRFAVAPSPAIPGSTATISGAIPMYGEAGQYIPPGPDDALHFWVDADPERWQDLIDAQGSPNAYFRPDVEPQQGTYLGSFDLSDPSQCTYRFGFEVPDLGPGAHTIVGLSFGGGGAAPLIDGDPLEVTRAGGSLETGPGRASCHDPQGDLMSEGSGDVSGSGPQPPDQQRDGIDLNRYSMARYSGGTLEMNFGAYGRIPEALNVDERLSFVLTGSSKDPGTTFASISATLRDDRWMVRIRNDDDDSEYVIAPEIAGNVLNLIIEPELVPSLMRGTFRWHAFSEWSPGGDPIYNDYCPDSGFPLFTGAAT